MRVLAFVGVFVVISIFTVGGAVLLALQLEGQSEWTWLSAVATTSYVIAPLLLGGVLAFWDLKRSTSARRGYRRTLIVTVVVQVLATVALSVYVALTRTPWWVVPVFTVAAIGLTAVAVTLGPVLRRSEKRSDRPAEGAAYPRADLRRDVRRIVVTGVVGLVVGGAGILALFLLFDEGEQPTWELPAFGLIFAVTAAAVACAFVSVRVARQIRDLVDGDVDRLKELGQVVVRRKKKITLSAENEAVAPRFAALSTVAQSYQLAQSLCVLGGIGAMQILRYVSDPSDSLTLMLIILFGVLLIAMTPLAVVQLRRTRKYALDHGEVIVEPRESSAGAA